MSQPSGMFVARVIKQTEGGSSVIIGATGSKILQSLPMPGCEEEDKNLLEEQVRVTLEQPVKRKLIFGEHMTPDVARERATPGSKQVKRKEGCELSALSSAHKRRSTLSGGECHASINTGQTPPPQNTPNRPLSALKMMMDTRIRSTSTPPLRRRGSRRVVKANPAGKIAGQRNIVQMLASRAEEREKGSQSSSERQKVEDSCQLSVPECSLKTSK